uniref:Putative ovule protein n=1 Tax=Solanum chacoense TaxID=4108 RepID=A0A0V0HWZ3_SOLCH
MAFELCNIELISEQLTTKFVHSIGELLDGPKYCYHLSLALDSSLVLPFGSKSYFIKRYLS